jgi:hypothetical protein
LTKLGHRAVASSRHTVENISPRLGESDTTDNVLKLLNEAPAR